MKKIINLILKAVFKNVLSRILKDYIAADLYAKSRIATIPDNDKDLVKACKRVGMTDIQTIRFLDVLTKEMGGYSID
ncbi:hypothetical protein [Staphylococcus pasteuri]|uniref:hypothetical protein n=1 Tax=Staphylococcus pasteuri TaxID=45972 RepID=UPI0036C1D6E8